MTTRIGLRNRSYRSGPSSIRRNRSWSSTRMNMTRYSSICSRVTNNSNQQSTIWTSWNRSAMRTFVTPMTLIIQKIEEALKENLKKSADFSKACLKRFQGRSNTITSSSSMINSKNTWRLSQTMRSRSFTAATTASSKVTSKCSGRPCQRNGKPYRKRLHRLRKWWKKPKNRKRKN